MVISTCEASDAIQIMDSVRGAAFLLLVINVAADKDSTVGGHGKKVMCYWGTWANYRPIEGKFTPEHVDGSLCTHLIYSFAGLDTAKWAIKSLDTWMDLEDDYGLAGFRKATDLRKTYPHLKVMVAIGGWNEGSPKYSQMAGDEVKRGKFVNSTVDFLKKYNFDGLDLDWEYPAKRGGSADDKKNFILLVRDLKAAFTEHKYLLTAAIGAGKATIDISYDVPNMYKYLDFVNVMCYDYHGRWDKRTGHNAPLRPRPNEDAQNSVLNVEYTINYLMKKGAKPEKTTLGVPLYGRSFLLKNSAHNHMGDAARANSFAGPVTREEGFLGYNEICKELTAPGSNWSVVWEKCHQAPYMFKGDRWVSYDNERSVRLKANFAFEQKLGGVMVWSIETDDFKGLCNGVKFPLLHTLNNALSLKTNGAEIEEEEECQATDYLTERTIVTSAPYIPPEPSSDITENNSEPETPASSSGGVCISPNEPNPDPTDCSQFYLCANGVPHLMTCRPGTLYSAPLMTCDHAFNVFCEAKPTTEKPVIDEEVTEEDTYHIIPPENDINDDNIVTQFTDEKKDKQVPEYPRDYNDNKLPRFPINNDVDNSIDEHKDAINNGYEFSKNNYVPNTSEKGMSSEAVAIIFLVILLLVVLLVLLWCFRAKIKDYAEPYLDNLTIERMRKPSTVSLLKAYKLNKIKWPSQEKPEAPQTANQPKIPPKDYSTRDLPPLPGAPVAPPRRKKSFSENLYESPLGTQSVA